MTGAPRSPPPAEVARGVAAERLRLLDLRTRAEPAVLGAPPGAQPVGLLRHVLHPQGEDAVYLCAHAVRSRWALRRGAAQVDGGFRRWRAERLPVVGRRGRS